MEGKLPSICVIIVVRDGVKTLRRAIESVVNQSYKKTSLVIIDGGSTDGTLDVINAYIDRIDYFESNLDKGIYDAMNRGLECCKGDWCLFLGCDDVLLDCFHLVAPRLIDKSAIYYGDVIKRSVGRRYAGRFSTLKLTYRNICHQAIF